MRQERTVGRSFRRFLAGMVLLLGWMASSWGQEPSLTWDEFALEDKQARKLADERIQQIEQALDQARDRTIPVKQRLALLLDLLKQELTHRA